MNNYYDETEVEDTFREVLNDSSPFEHIMPGVTLSLILADGQEEWHPLFELLSDYALVLFTIVPQRYDLHGVLLEWAILSYNYIEEKGSLSIKMQVPIRSAFPGLRMKKAEEEKRELFKRDLNTLYNAIGGGVVTTAKGAELTKILRDAYLNPGEYLPAKPSIKAPPVEPIREYLVSLELEGKSKLIDEYIKELSSL